MGSTMRSARICRRMLSSNAGSGDPGLAQAGSCRRSSENRSPSRKRGSAAMRSKTSAFETWKCRSAPFFSTRRSRSMLLHQVEAHFRIVEDRRVDALRASPQLFLLVADRLGEFGFGNLAAVEFRHFADAAAAAEVVVDAEERERNHDQRQNELRDPFVLVHEDQTSAWPCPFVAAHRSRWPRSCATAAGDVRLPAAPHCDRMRKGRTRVRPSNWRSGRDSNPRPPA